jgi:hypothetical protein
MKSLTTVLALLCSVSAFAANVTIAPGESLTLTPNSTTTVSCSGNGGGGGDNSCAVNEQALARELRNCVASMGNNNTDYCITKILTPAVKTKISDCSIAWEADCQEICVKAIGGNNTDYCMSKCKAS